MKFLLALQFKRLVRASEDWGLHPFVGTALLLCLLAVIWRIIPLRTWTPYALAAAIALLPGMMFSPSTSAFLEMYFSKKKLLTLRLFSSLLIASPFLLMLLCHGAFRACAIALVGLITTAALNLKGLPSRVIPTPYGHWPFEFTVGFRKSFWYLPLVIILLTMAIRVDNPNLGLFALALPYLIQTMYYTWPEDGFYPHIHKGSWSSFLVTKLKVASIYSLLSNLPFAFTYAAFFHNHLLPCLAVTVAGISGVLTSVLGKYANYPSEMNLLQAISIVAVLVFPPLALVIVPLLYSRALKNLSL